MKALTLHQPWASLIALGPKTVETRSWSAPAWVIGARIAIHAGKHRVRISNEFDPAMYHAMVQIHGPDWQNHLPLGAVVATAKLAGCFRVVGWNEGRQLKLEGTGAGGENIIPDPFGDFLPGRWLWVLEEIERLDPAIPAKGNRMLWNWEQTEAVNEPGEKDYEPEGRN